MEAIGCFLPTEERTIFLQGLVDHALAVNIVIPQRRRELSAYPTNAVQSMAIAGGQNGAPYTPSPRMELGVFSPRLGGNSHSEIFYVVDGPLSRRHEGCDLVLGRSSFIHRMLSQDGDPVAPITVPPLTPAQQQAQDAARAAERRRLEEERRQLEAAQRQARDQQRLR